MISEIVGRPCTSGVEPADAKPRLRIEQLAWMLFLKIMDDKDQELELLSDDYVSPIPAEYPEYSGRNWAADSEGITGEELQQFTDQRLFPALKELPAHDPRSFMVREVFEGNNNYMKSGTNLLPSTRDEQAQWH